MDVALLILGGLLLVGGYSSLKRGRGGKMTRGGCSSVVLGLVLVALGAALSGGRFKKDAAEVGLPPEGFTPSPPAVEVEASESGIWTDLEGRTMGATLLDVTRGEDRKLVARFKKTDGSVYTFPVDRLAPDDRARAESKIAKD